MGVTDRELMEQALEAMEEINKLSVGENAICLPAEIDGSMDALRERLAQSERTWVGLTDEEIQKMRHLIDWTAGWSYNTFARAVEAKLKEKNA